MLSSEFDSSFVVDAIKQEEAAAEKRYFDGLIHDGKATCSYADIYFSFISLYFVISYISIT